MEPWGLVFVTERAVSEIHRVVGVQWCVLLSCCVVVCGACAWCVLSARQVVGIWVVPAFGFFGIKLV